MNFATRCLANDDNTRLRTDLHDRANAVDEKFFADSAGANIAKQMSERACHVCSLVSTMREMELEAAASTIEVSESGIVIRWSDGGRSRFHALWLRDNCRSGGAKGSSRRTYSIAELNPELFVIEAARNDDGDLAVEFSDGHESIFDLGWLRASSHEPHDRLGRPRTISNFRAGHNLDEFDMPAPGSTEHCSLLESVAEWGAALVTGVPDVTGFEELAALVGRRRTETATDQRFTNATHPRTIEAYRYVPCGILVLHNCESSAGTNVFLVDGFGLATDMLDDNPDAFDQLSEIRVPFVSDRAGAAKVGHEVHLEASASVVTLDQDYELAGIRFDERSIAPLDLDPGQLGEYYAALIEFTRMVNDPGRALQVRLRPGDAVVFDNHRVLSGCSDDDTDGASALQSCASDRDQFHALLRQLRLDHARRGADERLPSGSTT
ncbi:MAG: DUF971 family protein [Verrucomicrobiales bacterium]